MKTHPFLNRAGLLSLIATALATAPASADLSSPYTADANTLHLWHLDEANPGPALPAAGVTGSFSLTPDAGKSPGFPATLGNAAFAGFGTAGNTAAGQGAGLKGVSTTVSSLTGPNGEYTFEALVKLANITDIQMIIGMDSNDTNANRPFQFRINGGTVTLVNIAGGANVVATIPTTGDDAFVANEWFHVAVTYDGNDNVAGNTKIYWTRMDPARIEANEISVGTEETDDLIGTPAIFGLGNDYRTSGTGNTANIEGSIDEVRISNVARAANEFLFFDGGPDVTNPLLVSTTPADDASNVLVSTNLVASFDEVVQAGTGFITLKRTSDDSTVEAFDVATSSQLSFGGFTVTIDPTSNLAGGVEHYVVIDATAIQDTAANAFAGIADTTAWSFTPDGTAPTVGSMGPMAAATEVSPLADLTLSFDETVLAGSGNITVHLASDDSVVATIDVTSGAVVINGSGVTILLPQLLGLTDYYVNIPSGAFTDPSGNAYAGISDTTSWAFTTAAIPEGLLYSHGFGGDSTDLDTTTPDVTTGGATWVASVNFNQDGSTDDGPGSATLAFTPFNGLVYTLEASYRAFSALPADNDWFALGFANGQSNTSTGNDRFITGTVVGAPWMMHRADVNLNTNQAFLGNGQLGGGNNGLGPGGVNNGVSWSLSTAEDAVDLRIVLDTTGGPGAWTATWYAKRPGDGGYTEVRPTEILYDPTTIGSVGLARSGAGVSGTVDSFKLYTGFPSDGDPLVLQISQSAGALDFEWNSMSGMQYDLVSSTDPEAEPDPALWASYNDGVQTYENIKATGATTMQTGVLKSGAVRFFALIEEPIPPLLSADFEANNGGFAIAVPNKGTGTEWSYGAPNSPDQGGGGVLAGNGGSTNCWATNLTGGYAAGTDACLRSGVIDLTSVSGATLSFAASIDANTGHTLTVNVIEAATDTILANILPATGDPNGLTSDWQSFGPLLIPGGAMGQLVRIEWRFTGDGGGSYNGVYLDDVVVAEN